MDRSPADSYRSRTNTALAVAVWVLAAAGAVAVAALSPGALHRVWVLVPLALVAVLAWEVFWQPRVTVDDDGVVLDELFHTVRIPWSIVVDVETQWALTIVAPHRRYRSSTAPAPGALARPAVGRVGSDAPFDARISDVVGTDSGDAATIVRRRWQRLVEAGRIPLGRAHLDRAEVRLHRGILTAVIVLAIASVVALLQL